MRTASLAAVVFLLLLCPVVSHAQLLRVVAVAGISQQFFAAYEDNQVWTSSGPPRQLTHVNRDVPIKQMQAFGGTSKLEILYADDQVYLADVFGEGFALFLDAHREGTNVVDMDCEDQNEILFAYDDCQLWMWTAATGLFRWEDLDRLDPASEVDDPIGKVFRGVSPNPSTGAFSVSFSVPSEGRVSIQLVDVSGRIVRSLLEGKHPAGDYSLVWNGRDDEGREVPAGVYLTRITTAEGTTTGRVVLTR